MRVIIADPSAPGGVRVAELAEPLELDPQMVRVRMLYAALNPADRLAAAGVYQPVGGLPPILGAEGVGVVEDVGAAVSFVSVGQRVLLMSRGNMTQIRHVAQHDLLPVPEGLTDEQAAILRINPATAAHMLERLSLQTGDALIQNAARSSVARWVRRLGEAQGLHIINVVRDAPQDEEIGDSPNLAADVRDHYGAWTIAGALDAVAGQATGRLAACLNPNAMLLVYGHLSGEPCQIASTQLTTKSLSVNGFTLRSVQAAKSRADLTNLYRYLGGLAAADPEPIKAIFPLDDVADALAFRSTQRGRIILSC
jgi:NADPH:quinone reductase-like Zn-dependent oxidoreductase